MKVYLIKTHYGDIRTYHKGYKGPFSVFKRQYNKLIEYYEETKDQHPGKVKEIQTTMNIVVYMADEITPLTKIDEYP